MTLLWCKDTTFW